MKDFGDLKHLISITRSHFTKLTFEATVDTGFEQCAVEECLEKLGKSTSIAKTRGRIFFNTKFDKTDICHNFRSIDHLNVLAGFHTIPFNTISSKNLELEEIKKCINCFDWEKVLSVWQDSNQFEGTLFPSLEEYKSALTEETSKNKSRDKGKHYGFDETYLEQKRIERNERENIFKTENIPVEKTPMEVALDQIEDGAEDEKTVVKENIVKIPKFRVTCNRVGNKHSFSSMDAAWVFGGALHDKYKWLIDLKNHDLEIILQITDNDLYVGVSLNKISKHFRNINYFGYTTLRSTVSYNMLKLCEPKVGDVIVDPLCGTGSIPIEGSLAFPFNYYMCGDMHVKSVNKALNNINCLKFGLDSVLSSSNDKGDIAQFDEKTTTNKNLRIDCAYWDVTKLPLRDESVDIFITDLPFGKRSGSKSNNKHLYKKCLEELARVVRKRTGRAVFLTYDKKCFTHSYYITNKLWRQVKVLAVNIGGLEAGCFILQRLDTDFKISLSKTERKKIAREMWLLKQKQQLDSKVKSE